MSNGLVALLISAAILALGSWLAIMFVWWQQETGKTQQSATTIFASSAEDGARLARRGWYRFVMKLRVLGQWSNRKAQSAFFKLFPNAKPAFVKHDQLAGLKHGPSSFFLRSISESVSEPTVSNKTV